MNTPPRPPRGCKYTIKLKTLAAAVFRPRVHSKVSGGGVGAGPRSPVREGCLEFLPRAGREHGRGRAKPKSVFALLCLARRRGAAARRFFSARGSNGVWTTSSESLYVCVCV